jgi:UDP-N-acetyl-D-mannosaminuronic acid dehydrogenase
VQAALGSGNLVISDHPEPADGFIIAVPTPFHDDKRADLRFVVSAAQAIVPHLRAGNLVVLESTSPPRTTLDIVAPILERSGMKVGPDIHLAFARAGIAGANPAGVDRKRPRDRRIRPPLRSGRARSVFPVCAARSSRPTPTTAEMVKLMENTYRDVISPSLTSLPAWRSALASTW